MRTCGGVARGDERLEPSGTGIRQDDTAMAVTTTSNPFTPRPDETERRARLTRMKRVATGLLALSGGVFVVTAWLEGRYPWLGYVRAMAEASLVGGLADWFAVTALFRHPLGLPIPHTAIIPAQKARLGAALGCGYRQPFRGLAGGPGPGGGPGRGPRRPVAGYRGRRRGGTFVDRLGGGDAHALGGR